MTTMPDTDTDIDTAHCPGVLFEAELRPNRSSTPAALHRIGLILSAVLVPAGLIFVYVGAWPVFGFLGLEIVALYALLHYNHRRTAMVERIALTDTDMIVERIDPWGRRRSWSFRRHWLQVNVAHPDSSKSMLELRSHGETLTIGAFLTPSEHLAVAADLRRALRAVCAPLTPEPA